MPTPFPGFTAADFDLFAIPDFAGRMAELRASLRPKLVALGDALAGEIEGITGVPTVAHTAQHMRRRVNPPAETWVAFGRDRKGYKRWAHYRVAVSGAGVRVTVFVEDDSDDKPGFGAHLQAEGAALLTALQAAPVVWYTLDGDRPVPATEVTPETLAHAGGQLQRLKGAKFQAGLPISRSQALALDAPAFQRWALEQARLLKPLYLAACAG